MTSLHTGQVFTCKHLPVNLLIITIIVLHPYHFRLVAKLCLDAHAAAHARKTEIYVSKRRAPSAREDIYDTVMWVHKMALSKDFEESTADDFPVVEQQIEGAFVYLETCVSAYGHSILSAMSATQKLIVCAYIKCYYT